MGKALDDVPGRIDDPSRIPMMSVGRRAAFSIEDVAAPHGWDGGVFADWVEFGGSRDFLDSGEVSGRGVTIPTDINGRVMRSVLGRGGAVARPTESVANSNDRRRQARRDGP